MKSHFDGNPYLIIFMNSIRLRLTMHPPIWGSLAIGLGRNDPVSCLVPWGNVSKCWCFCYSKTTIQPCFAGSMATHQLSSTNGLPLFSMVKQALYHPIHPVPTHKNVGDIHPTCYTCVSWCLNLSMLSYFTLHEHRDARQLENLYRGHGWDLGHHWSPLQQRGVPVLVPHQPRGCQQYHHKDGRNCGLAYGTTDKIWRSWVWAVQAQRECNLGLPYLSTVGEKNTHHCEGVRF